MQRQALDTVDREIQYIARCELSNAKTLYDINANMCNSFLIFEDSAAQQIFAELMRLMPFEEGEK